MIFDQRRILIRIEMRLKSVTSDYYPNAEIISSLTIFPDQKKMVTIVISNSSVASFLTTIRKSNKAQSEMIRRSLNFAWSECTFQSWPWYHITCKLHLTSKLTTCMVANYEGRCTWELRKIGSFYRSQYGEIWGIPMLCVNQEKFDSW